MDYKRSFLQTFVLLFTLSYGHAQHKKTNFSCLKVNTSPYRYNSGKMADLECLVIGAYGRFNPFRSYEDRPHIFLDDGASGHILIKDTVYSMPSKLDSGINYLKKLDLLESRILSSRSNLLLLTELEQTKRIQFNGVIVTRFLSPLLAKLKNFEFNFSCIDSLRLTRDSIDRFIIFGGVARYVSVEGSVIKSMSCTAECDGFKLWHCQLLNQPDLSLGMPHYISLEGCDLSKLTGVWDLDRLKRGTPHKPFLRLEGIDISKIKFDYSKFILDTSRMSFEDRQTLYINLKAQYTNLGMAESYKLVDIDLIKLNNNNNGWIYRIADRLNRYWWNYGYDKGLVFFNSVILFIFFAIVNFLVGLRNLIENGYSLSASPYIYKRIKTQKNEVGRIWFTFWYTILFTSIVFWGIHLDKKELKFQNLGYLFYIMIQYLVGVVCLAYLAAYILGK